jgi:hypothetical protein
MYFAWISRPGFEKFMGPPLMKDISTSPIRSKEDPHSPHQQVHESFVILGHRGD